MKSFGWRRFLVGVSLFMFVTSLLGGCCFPTKKYEDAMKTIEEATAKAEAAANKAERCAEKCEKTFEKGLRK